MEKTRISPWDVIITGQEFECNELRCLLGMNNKTVEKKDDKPLISRIISSLTCQSNRKCTLKNEKLTLTEREIPLTAFLKKTYAYYAFSSEEKAFLSSLSLNLSST